MGNVQSVTTEEFNEIIKNEKRPVIIDSWAPWCGPCKSISPYFEKLSEEFGDRMRFVKVNVDEEPEIAQRYMITSLPTFVIVENGEPLNSLIGSKRQKLYAFIKEALKED